MELKEIKVNDILANFYQPRTKFDRENIKELSESILSNGLINPITVTPDKKRKGKFMIVSGERRWQAHKISDIKFISSVVKEYKSDGQFMVESLIENIHRENLTPEEKAKFCQRIMKEEGLDMKGLSQRINSSHTSVSQWLDLVKVRKANPRFKDVSASVIYETKSLPEEQRIKVLEKAQKEDLGNRAVREIVKQVKQEPIPEPIQLEETANDVAGEILSNFSSLTDNIKKLLKEMNMDDLKKHTMDRLLTSSGIFVNKILPNLLEELIKKGAKPDKTIVALIRAKDGKI